jgi:hypothetical protein
MAVKTAGALKLNICLIFGPRRNGNLPSKNKYLVVKVINASKMIVIKVIVLLSISG